MPARTPTEELIADLQETAADHGEPLTYREYNEYGSHSAGAIQNRFDGWNNGLREAGIEVGQLGGIEPVDVLNDLQRVTDEGIGISCPEYQSVGKLSPEPALTHFDTWWKATVSAGLSPVEKRPLTPEQFDQYYRTVNNLSAGDALSILLFMFSGMSVRTASELSPQWVRENRDRNILRVPPGVTGGNPWLVRLPETWYNPHTEERTPTTLPETLEWVLSNYGGIQDGSTATLHRRCLEVARDVDMQSREQKSYSELGEIPHICPADLSYTYGANLVRQGVNSEVIERQLGTDGYRNHFYVDDVMLWVYVHDGYKHPEFDPPPVVLDPDTGKPRYS